MIRRTTDLSVEALAAYDAVIDVRSPAEFAEDHLPGAINLPVLDNEERAEIGTLFVQKSKFLARRLGAAKVARNIAAHLDGPLADRGGSFRPLVYCWRGGQRSGAMVTVMDQVGWPVTVLEGGYQTWRREVAGALYDTATPFSLKPVLLDGPTGSGKTALLEQLVGRGVQTLDLEALAAHRGSLFGAMAEPQPDQKLFESRLYDALRRLDPGRPVVVEAESSRVGERVLPPALWAAMRAAPVIEVSASPEDRVRSIIATYSSMTGDLGRLDAALSRLPRHHSKAAIARWREMAAARDFGTLVAELIEAHYDPAYRRTATTRGARVLGKVDAGDIGQAALERAAGAVMRLLDES